MPDSTGIIWLITLGQGLRCLAVIYVWVIIIRVLLTWINPNPHSPVMRLLSKAVDPVLDLGRRLFPLRLGGLDFSPIVVVIIIQLLGAVLGGWLISLGLGQPVFTVVPLLVQALISLLDSLAWLLVIIMAARLIMSLVHPSPYNIIVQVVFGLTEPLLAPLRRFFPPGPGGLDYRPLVFLVIVILIQQVVLGGLAGAAAHWMGEVSRGWF